MYSGYSSASVGHAQEDLYMFQAAVSEAAI